MMLFVNRMRKDTGGPMSAQCSYPNPFDELYSLQEKHDAVLEALAGLREEVSALKARVEDQERRILHLEERVAWAERGRSRTG